MLNKSADYALIVHHALRHVGLKLEGAAPAALSISDMASDYDHPNPADFHRVKLHEKLADDRAAKKWIIRYAVSLLNGSLAVDGDMVSFATGKGFDDLKWSGGKVERPGPDPYARLQNAFSPISGAFADNIREELGDLSELRDSMKAWGWIDRSQFRALGDSRTRVVLIGHRRIKVATELGIDWQKHIDWIDIGDGDAADAERFKLAIASNIGAKKLSPNDRKRIAAHLYSDHEWSQAKIAEALLVSQRQISSDLNDLEVTSKSKRGKPRKEKSKNDPVTAAEERRTVTPEQEEEIGRLLDEGLSRGKVAEQLGLGEKVVQLSQQRHLGRMEERQRIEHAKKEMTAQLQTEIADHFCTCPICGHRHQSREPRK